MLIPEQVEIFVHCEPTDMRQGYNSLAGLAREVLEQEPSPGKLFVFYNRNRQTVKLLYWHFGGFAVWSKRLQEGRYLFPKAESGSMKLSRRALRLILECGAPQTFKNRIA
jgi:transposase